MQQVYDIGFPSFSALQYDVDRIDYAGSSIGTCVELCSAVHALRDLHY